jgi:hypothetical protein
MSFGPSRILLYCDLRSNARGRLPASHVAVHTDSPIESNRRDFTVLINSTLFPRCIQQSPSLYTQT